MDSHELSRVVKQTEPDGSVTQKRISRLDHRDYQSVRATHYASLKMSLAIWSEVKTAKAKPSLNIYDGFNNPIEMRDSLGQVTQMSWFQSLF